MQNEKATVSRAVSQNVELKKLLEEFQDKIIVVTNDCAAKEEEKNSLVVKLSALQRSFDEHLVNLIINLNHEKTIQNMG